MPRASLIAATIAGLSLSLAAQPANDECTGAIAVSNGLNGPFDSTSATTSSPAWPCALGGSDLWFAYTHGAVASSVTANTCTGTSFDTAIQVFSGDCSSLASIGCNDDSCGLQSSLTWTAAANTTYLIRVGGFNGGRGTFNLEVAAPPPCPNADECVNALPVTIGATGPLSNACATDSLPAWPCGGTASSDLWFAYTHIGAPGATVDANTCTGSQFDTKIQVFSGDCSNLTSIQCNDDDCGLQSRVTWAANQNETYYIRVGGFAGSTGSFTLTLTVNGSFTSNGGGCGGTALTASSNAASGLPELGSTLSFNLNAAGMFQAIWLGLPQAPVTICPGCDQCCSMLALVPHPTLTATVPNDPSLCGASLCIQGIDVFVPAGPGCDLGGFSVTVSDCIDVVIGC